MVKYSKRIKNKFENSSEIKNKSIKYIRNKKSKLNLLIKNYENNIEQISSPTIIN